MMTASLSANVTNVRDHLTVAGKTLSAPRRFNPIRHKNKFTQTNALISAHSSCCCTPVHKRSQKSLKKKRFRGDYAWLLHEQWVGGTRCSCRHGADPCSPSLSWRWRVLPLAQRSRACFQQPHLCSCGLQPCPSSVASTCPSHKVFDGCHSRANGLVFGWCMRFQGRR